MRDRNVFRTPSFSNHNPFGDNPFRPSFTERLIKAVIIMTGVGIFGVVIASMFGAGCLDQRPTAEVEARRWATDIGMTITGVTCANRDTDNDGYVSCTVATKNTKGDIELHPIECAARMSWNDGCRAPKFRVNNGTGQ